MRPRIGITTYGRDRGNSFSLPAEYVDAVRRAGGTAFLLPPSVDDVGAWLDAVDGFVLAGGGDVDPARYGGSPHETVYMVDAERDGAELALARLLIEDRRPTLAICRGAQVVNVALGGTLHTHVPDAFGDATAHRLPPRDPTSHRVRVDPESRLAGLLGETEFESASWHHQAVDRPGSGLAVVAQAPDGVIEALESRTHPWLFGVQWHPELTAAKDPVQQRLFDALVGAAAGKSEGKEPRGR